MSLAWNIIRSNMQPTHKLAMLVSYLLPSTVVLYAVVRVAKFFASKGIEATRLTLFDAMKVYEMSLTSPITVTRINHAHETKPEARN